MRQPIFRLRTVLITAALALVLVACRESNRSTASTPVTLAMNRGVSLMGQYQYEGAVQAFEEVLRLEPGSEAAQLNLAIALFNRNRKEDLDAATKLLDELLRKNRENVGALYFKAIVLQHVGKAEEALPLLQSVVLVRPDDGAAWYILALCKLRLGQPAAPEFLKAVQYRPYLFSAYYQLYQAALREDKPEQAKEYLEKFKLLRESPLGESIELPQYNQMGELALVSPQPAVKASPVARTSFELREPRLFGTVLGLGAVAPVAANHMLDNGVVEVMLCSGGRFQTVHLAQGMWQSPLIPDAQKHYVSAGRGDLDNDGKTDAWLVLTNGVELYINTGISFTNITPTAGIGCSNEAIASATLADADHDGDLDMLVCGSKGVALWNNNGDLTFTNVTTLRSEAMPGGATSVMLADLDNDRDGDLVVVGADAVPHVFQNLLLGNFSTGRALTNAPKSIAGTLNFLDTDNVPDLLLLTEDKAEPLVLMLGDGHGGFRRTTLLAQAGSSVGSRGKVDCVRVADLDLDGDLDIVTSVSGMVCTVLSRNGEQFVFGTERRPNHFGPLQLVACDDFNTDFVPDVLAITLSNNIVLLPGALSTPSTALAIQPTGIRSRDGRTRSPASAFGLKLSARAGLRETARLHTGQNGGTAQSTLPVMLGLDGASKADYLSMAWPDGIAQVEIGLTAGQLHAISEIQRKVSSCPVLFTWNGRRFEFVTDFAGVGGLGYFTAPGIYAPPQVLEHVKIEPGQLQATNGAYELRITEPMEEAAYIDRLELLAVDHPQGWSVFPDERLAIGGAAPTHDLLVVTNKIFANKAVDPWGRDCAANLKSVDRIYAYSPPLDRRYIGFAKQHTLELDFGSAPNDLANAGRVFLFIQGFIEYPYSQTVYAASQSRLAWEPIRIERQDADGTLITIVADAGAPGGMARMMTVDMSGLLTPATRKLRLTTNLEVFYDQVFLAADAGKEFVRSSVLPLTHAQLRRVGFAREFSPDGNLPLIYDYDLTEPTAPFHVMKGAYTGYGDVSPLLSDFDDMHVIMGPGDELAVRFAAGVGSRQEGYTRSFVLVSHAYCKDMDLYTGTPQTLEPLPFRGMTHYPYSEPESYPATPEHERYRREWNTRVVD